MADSASSTSSRCDVLVAGAGPVGVAMSTYLTRLGLKVRVIDKAPSPSSLSKAVVIMPRTLEELELRGVADSVVAAGHRLKGFVAYAEGRLIMDVRYDRLDTKYNYLLCVPQYETERLLNQALRDRGLTVERPVELVRFEDEGGQVRAWLRHLDEKDRLEEVTASWLIGCDGAHSLVRKSLNFPFEGGTYKDVWLLGDVKLDWDFANDLACTFFGPEGYLAVFPMPNGRSRIFGQRRAGYPEGVPITLAEIQEMMDRWSTVPCRVSDPVWMTEFHVHHRRAPHYRKGRIFLAGDAAHISSPETGLGMNTGLQDAYNLAWKIALVEKEHSPDSLLDTYDIEREAVAKEVIDYSHALHVGSSVTHPIAKKMRNRVFELFNQFFHLHFSSIEKQVELRIHYRRSPIVRQTEARHIHLPFSDSRPEAGGRCPDARLLRLSDKSWITLYREFGVLHHNLLLLAGFDKRPDSVERLRACAKLVARYPVVVRPWMIVPGADASLHSFPGVEVYADSTHELHDRFGSEHDCFYLVRPDGYIGQRSFPADPAELEHYLSWIFHPR